jgi:adenylate kinase
VGLRAIVVGVPGVGKTTVVEKLVTRYHGARLVNFGSVMFERGLILRWIKHRDELRRLTVDRQRKLQRIAASKISRMKDRVVIVDTHLFIRTKEGFWPGLPFEVVRAMKPTHLVLIEASPKEILMRRSADKSRYRDNLAEADMTEELGLARSFMTVSSTLTGAPMFVISNADGKADRVASTIATMLKGAAS